MLRQGSRTPAVAQCLARHTARYSSLWSSTPGEPSSSSASTSTSSSPKPPRPTASPNGKGWKNLATDPSSKWEAIKAKANAGSAPFYDGSESASRRAGRKPTGDKKRKGSDAAQNPKQERRLNSFISTAKPGQVESMKKADFKQSDTARLALDPEIELGTQVMPGDFIVARRNNIATVGVSLGYSYAKTRPQIVMFTPSGEIWVPFPSDITFVLPSFISPNLVDRCGLGDIPTNERELGARTEVLKRLRGIVHELEAKVAAHVVGKKVYDTVKSRTEWGSVSVAEVARMVESNPGYQSIFAVQHHLMEDSLHYVAQEPFLTTQAFDVRPEEEVELIEKVTEWVREKDERIGRFVEKAKPIVQETAQRIKESAKEPPQVSKAKQSWTADEKEIVKFLTLALRPVRKTQTDPYMTGTTTIMRLLDVETDLMGPEDLFKLLINLGAVAPWQDPVVIQRPNTEPETTNPIRERKDIITLQRSLKSQAPADGPLGPHDFYPTDPLEAVRHDFGDLPAFVIDSEDAQELDDAISIERIPSEPGSYWVHAHVANPTATLPPTHVFAKYALKECTTLYFQHHSVPLFSPSLTHNPDLGWSLGSQKGRGSRTITFSAKIDASGEIVAHKVRAGVINNIHVISYKAVNQILGTERVKAGLLTYPFGGPTALSTGVVVPELPERELEALRDLNKLRGTLHKNWLENNVARLVVHNAHTTFGEFPKGSMTPSLEHRAFSGFPEFSGYEVESGNAIGSGAEGMVAEVMIIAGRVASRFGKEHNIPLLRRVCEGLSFMSPQHMQAVRELRSSYGGITMRDAVMNVACTYPARYDMQVGPHEHVGARADEGYVRATSPLRRAMDLVVHWQLHRALLGQHAKASDPTFDRDWLDQFRVSYAIGEYARRKQSRDHEKYWTAVFLKKWMSGELRGEGFTPYDPDRTFDAYALDEGMIPVHKSVKDYDVEVPELGLMAMMEVDHRRYRVLLGQKVQVRLKRVDLGVTPRVEFAYIP